MNPFTSHLILLAYLRQCRLRVGFGIRIVTRLRLIPDQSHVDYNTVCGTHSIVEAVYDRCIRLRPVPWQYIFEAHQLAFGRFENLAYLTYPKMMFLLFLYEAHKKNARTRKRNETDKKRNEDVKIMLGVAQRAKAGSLSFIRRMNLCAA